MNILKKYINFRWRWFLRYTLIWYQFHLLLLLIRDFLFVFWIKTFDLLAGILIPMYLKRKLLGSWVIVCWALVTWGVNFISCKILVDRMGSLTGVNIQYIQYHAHLISSNCSSLMYNRFVQLCAPNFKLITIVSKVFSFESFKYWNLSSTKPTVIIIIHDSL